MTERALREQNRRSWNEVVPVHHRHRGDQVAFFRSGGSTLFDEERALLGPLTGQRVAHLFCNAGQDSISMALQGADVLGVDISDAAIALATALAADTAASARFVRADVYDWLDSAPGLFDIVYCAYGAICWLNDLHSFAAGVAQVLAPHGRFILMEFHPVSNMFSADWAFTRPYPASGRQLALDGVGDYVGASAGGLAPATTPAATPTFQNPEPCTLFQWGVGEVVTALAQAGLILTTLQEFPFVNGERPFERMRATPERRMYPPEDVPAPPLMYGLVARRAGEP